MAETLTDEERGDRTAKVVDFENGYTTELDWPGVELRWRDEANATQGAFGYALAFLKALYGMPSGEAPWQSGSL